MLLISYSSMQIEIKMQSIAHFQFSVIFARTKFK
jgi:hypothetical protein